SADTRLLHCGGRYRRPLLALSRRPLWARNGLPALVRAWAFCLRQPMSTKPSDQARSAHPHASGDPGPRLKKSRPAHLKFRSRANERSRTGPSSQESAYAELAVTTNFSFLRGASHPWEMVAMADELDLDAIGIADRNTLAGVVRAFETWKKIEERKTE